MIQNKEIENPKLEEAFFRRRFAPPEKYLGSYNVGWENFFQESPGAMWGGKPKIKIYTPLFQYDGTLFDVSCSFLHKQIGKNCNSIYVITKKVIYNFAVFKCFKNLCILLGRYCCRGN